jgi:zinc transport system substrate-binding protein
MYRAVLAIILCLPFSLQAADIPRVLVSIKPIHSLVSALLHDVAEADLLLTGLESPHTHQLKPSEAMRLHSADVIIWVGPALESFLAKHLRALHDKTIITLTHDDHENVSHDLHTDPHRWLDPILAIADSRTIARHLIARYPYLEPVITKNLDTLTRKLLSLDQELLQLFQGSHEISAILFHDAWSYFTRRYQLEIHGIINPQPHSQPGVRHLNNLQQTLSSQGTRCLLIEPQFKPRYLQTLSANPSIAVRIIDPLATNEAAGIDAYFNMMHSNASVFAQCR